MEEKDFKPEEVELAEVEVEDEDCEIEDESNIEPPTQTSRSNRKTFDMTGCFLCIMVTLVSVALFFFIGSTVREPIKELSYNRKQKQASILVHRGGVLSVERLQVIGGIGKVENITKGEVAEECKWTLSSKLTLDDNVTVHTVIPQRITIEPITWWEPITGNNIRYLIKPLQGTCSPKEPMPEIEISGDLEIGNQFRYPVDPKKGFFLILTETRTQEFEFYRNQLFVKSRP